MLPLFPLAGHWVEVKDGNELVAQMYARHYSSYRYADRRRSQHGYRNRFLVLGPGEKMVLLSVDGLAIFGWRRFKDDSGQVGVNCAFFRNEGATRSSELILAAEQHARRRWGGARLYTYVNPRAVRSTNPGYCFLVAGWRKCGSTKGGLLILEKDGEEGNAVVDCGSGDGCGLCGGAAGAGCAPAAAAQG